MLVSRSFINFESSESDPIRTLPPHTVSGRRLAASSTDSERRAKSDTDADADRYIVQGHTHPSADGNTNCKADTHAHIAFPLLP